MNGTIKIVIQQASNAATDANVFIDFDGDGSADVGLDFALIDLTNNVANTADLSASDFIA